MSRSKIVIKGANGVESSRRRRRTYPKSAHLQLSQKRIRQRGAHTKHCPAIRAGPLLRYRPHPAQLHRGASRAGADHQVGQHRSVVAGRSKEHEPTTPAVLAPRLFGPLQQPYLDEEAEDEPNAVLADVDAVVERLVGRTPGGLPELREGHGKGDDEVSNAAPRVQHVGLEYPRFVSGGC